MKLSELYDGVPCGYEPCGYEPCAECGMYHKILPFNCDIVWKHLCDCMMDEFTEALYELGEVIRYTHMVVTKNKKGVVTIYCNGVKEFDIPDPEFTLSFGTPIIGGDS
jgi:hypothetical protein